MANKAAGSFAHLLEPYYKLGKSEEQLPLKTYSIAHGGNLFVIILYIQTRVATLYSNHVYAKSHSFSPILDLKRGRPFVVPLQ